MFCANDTNLLGVNKHTLCEERRRGASLGGNKEFSLVENAEVKARKILSTKVGKRQFGSKNIWEKKHKN